MLHKKDPELLYDLRTLENFLSRGLIKQSEYDKYLKSLPDDEGNYEEVKLEEELFESEEE